MYSFGETRKANKMAGDINKITDVDVAVFATMVKDPDVVNALDMYQHIATKTAIYPGHGTPLGLVYVALKGAGEAGEFAEHVGKAMRDDNLISEPYTREFDDKTQIEFKDLTPDWKEKLIKEVGDQLWYISAKCNELGISLSQAALINLKKLNGRSKAGTLGGSGDDL